MMIRPEIEHAPREFAPIVREDTLRSAALCNQRITHFDNVLTSQLLPDLYCQSLAAEDVDDRQRTKTLPVRQLIGNETTNVWPARVLRFARRSRSEQPEPGRMDRPGALNRSVTRHL
jgi:hypothetical protein